MKIRLLLALTLACATRSWAQPAAVARPVNDSLFRLVTPAQAQTFDTPIAIHLSDVTLERALLELQNQSGVPLDLSNLRAKVMETKLSIDIETPSFNRALDAIADEAALELELGQFGRASPRLVTLKSPLFRAPDFSNAPISSDGLFVARLVKLDVTLFQSLDWSDGTAPARAQNDHLNLSFQLAPDPRLPVVGAARLRVTRADDEAGRSLLPAPVAPKAPFYFFNSDIIDAPTMVALLPPSGGARQLAHLEGAAIYVLTRASQRLEVPDVLNAGKTVLDFTNGGQKVRLTLQEVERQGEDLKVNLTITAPKGSDWGPLSNPLFSPDKVLSWAHFEDADGTLLRAKRDGGGGVSGNGMNARATFALPRNMAIFPAPKTATTPATVLALPIKFVFDAPTEFVQTEVPFSFENVPLP